MKGIHINWTEPWSYKYPGKVYKQQQYELLVQLLSVLYWKRHHGPIKLYTDDTGVKYYNSLNIPLLDLYDDVHILDPIQGIDPGIFWAGGKIVSIQNETAPFVMLDLDLFITDNLIPEFKGHDLVFSHYETLNHPVYPNPKDITPNGVNLSDYNWTILPGNVCLTYFGDEKFKDRYTSESIQYMKSFENLKELHFPDKHNSRMVYAEQRLLTCIADDMKLKFKPLINDIYNSNTNHVKYNGNELNAGEEPSWFSVGSDSNIGTIPIHHTWGYKHLLVNKGIKLLYVESLQKLIRQEFPEYTQYLGDPRDE